MKVKAPMGARENESAAAAARVSLSSRLSNKLGYSYSHKKGGAESQLLAGPLPGDTIIFKGVSLLLHFARYN